MKIVTRESRAVEVYRLWCMQYGPRNDSEIRTYWATHFGKDGKEVSGEIVANKLKELGSNPDPDDVDEIIGNKSWTRVPTCCECKQETQAIVLFHSREDVVEVCGMCLLKALNIMEEVHV